MSVLASITEHEYSTPELAGLPEGWLRLLGLLLLIGLGYAVFWLYRREARIGAPPALRIALGCLRGLIFLLLAIIWLEPVIATYTVRTTTAGVAVLTDVSASMAVVDADETPAPTSQDAAVPRPSRLERVATRLHGDDHAWLRRLAERNDLMMYTFGERTQAKSLPWERPVAASQPANGGGGGVAEPQALAAVQNHTDLGQALTRVLADAGESPLAAIVVLSDGNLNRGLSADDAAAYARRFQVPIYTVGVGSPREPPNLRITGFAAPVTVAKADPFEVRVGLAAVGVEPMSVQLELWSRPADERDGSEEVLATRRASVGGDQGGTEVRFVVSAAAAGEFIYRVRAEALAGEAVRSDNQREAGVLVLDERLRVLLVAGRPSYEYRYVARLLERDKMIDLSCWLQSADAQAVRDGNTLITKLPRRPEEVFEYDVLLLLDPNPSGLDSAWALTARRLVDEFGGGLFLQAGSHFTNRFLRDPRLEDLVTLLPIVPDPDSDVRLSEQGAFRTRPHPILIPDEARRHPLLRLADDGEMNRGVWGALPGVWWHLPVLREKPLATVLMRHGRRAYATRHGQPVLLAAQPFGAGRAVFLAFDSTWRWRSSGERYYNRFWVQLVRYLAQPRREGVSKRGTIVLDREVIRRGDYVKIEARVLDATFVPWHQSRIEGTVEPLDGALRPLTLEAIPGREGWFAGRLAIDWTGPAVIRVSLPGGDEGGAQEPREPALVKHIQVETSDVELRSLRLWPEPLMKLADETGGRYLPLSEAAVLPDLIENASQVKTTRSADDPLWDKGWVLVLIAALLGIEWTLRRRNHLL